MNDPQLPLEDSHSQNTAAPRYAVISGVGGHMALIPNVVVTVPVLGAAAVVSASASIGRFQIIAGPAMTTPIGSSITPVAESPEPQQIVGESEFSQRVIPDEITGIITAVPYSDVELDFADAFTTLDESTERIISTQAQTSALRAETQKALDNLAEVVDTL